jgi:hypothetical protein
MAHLTPHPTGHPPCFVTLLSDECATTSAPAAAINSQRPTVARWLHNQHTCTTRPVNGAAAGPCRQLTSAVVQTSRSVVQSTWAILMFSWPLKAVASSPQAGARRLQCPASNHTTAKAGHVDNQSYVQQQERSYSAWARCYAAARAHMHAGIAQCTAQGATTVCSVAARPQLSHTQRQRHAHPGST